MGNDKIDCIGTLMAAGMTWAAAAWLFYEDIQWHASERLRRELVSHFCELAREDAQLRREE